MIDRGLKSLFPYEEISKMGFIDPLLSIKNLLKKKETAYRLFHSRKTRFFYRYR